MFERLTEKQLLNKIEYLEEDSRKFPEMISGQTSRTIELPPLERKCPRCAGTGQAQNYSELNECTYCDGVGYIPTKIGKRIVALMLHNLRPANRRIRQD